MWSQTPITAVRYIQSYLAGSWSLYISIYWTFTKGIQDANLTFSAASVLGTSWEN